MIAKAQNWFQETLRVYIGNATTTRDFRVQLRGNKAVILFSIYLVLLILFSMLIYDQASHSGQMNIVEAQTRLKDFYNWVMIMLGMAICLIAPAMASSTIVVEKQNRLMDLVFSAPVTARYYLVGKLIGIYRFIVLILVLSVPVTASCVMLGGATWQGVLESYLYLSTAGLVIASIGLIHSCMGTKPTQAMISAYFSTIFYLLLSGVIQGIGLSMRMAYASGTRTSINDVPVFSTLGPFYAHQLAGSFMTVLGVQVPNAILNVVVSLLIVRLILKGCESLIAPSGTYELRRLRVDSLLYAFFAYALFGWLVGPWISTIVGSSPSTNPKGFFEGIAPFWLLTFLGWMIIPVVTCFGYDNLNRFRPNGLFDLRTLFNGTPSGALPFIWALWLCFYVGGAVGFAMVGIETYRSFHYWAFAFLTFASWTLLWAACRYSSASLRGVKTSRNFGVVFLLILMGLLPAVFSTVAFGQVYAEGANIWDWYPYRAAISGPDKTYTAYIHGAVMLVLSVIMVWAAEARLKKTLTHTRWAIYGKNTSA